MRSLLYRTSSYSTPAQSRPSFTWSNASGRRGFSSEPIVSSKTSSSRPWYRFVYASFKTNARATPQGGILREEPAQDRLRVRVAVVEDRVLQRELPRRIQAHGRPNRTRV